MLLRYCPLLLNLILFSFARAAVFLIIQNPSQEFLLMQFSFMYKKAFINIKQVPFQRFCQEFLDIIFIDFYFYLKNEHKHYFKSTDVGTT